MMKSFISFFSLLLSYCAFAEVPDCWVYPVADTVFLLEFNAQHGSSKDLSTVKSKIDSLKYLSVQVVEIEGTDADQKIVYSLRVKGPQVPMFGFEHGGLASMMMISPESFPKPEKLRQFATRELEVLASITGVTLDCPKSKSKIWDCLIQ